MRVIEATIGAFHFFDLGRELEKRHHLDRIYTTWPWLRLKREGLPQKYVRSFPWVHTPQMILWRYNVVPPALSVKFDLLARVTFDRWLQGQVRNQPAPDALISLSSNVVSAAIDLQARGTRFICDRPGTHALFQERVLREEALRWGTRPPVSEPEILKRDVWDSEIADAICVPSYAAAKTFPEFGIPMEKIHVIPYGVRLENFRKTADARADSFEVLFVGGVSLRKGIPYLLEAFAGLRHTKKRLRVVGGMKPEMKELLARLPHGADVEFVGSVPSHEVASLMSRSHLLVLPSIEDGFGLVVPQAMACGCPVLVSSSAGGCEMVTEGVDGFVVEPRDSAAMTDRMQQLADDPALQQRMGAAAMEKVKTLGGWHHYGDLWEALLRKVTGKQ